MAAGNKCVSAGELLPASVRDSWRQATGMDIIDGYGASETLVLVLTGFGCDDGLQPSPGVEAEPLDAQAAEAGTPTRLKFRVSTLALGYLDRPAAQAENFRDGAFCPADLFVRTSSGGWRFAGRVPGCVHGSTRRARFIEIRRWSFSSPPAPRPTRTRLPSRWQPHPTTVIRSPTS